MYEDGRFYSSINELAENISWIFAHEIDKMIIEGSLTDEAIDRAFNKGKGTTKVIKHDENYENMVD